MCEDAIASAAKALLTGDNEILGTVFNTDRDIDRQARDIEALCMKLLLQQQPVAKDLRMISAALKMVSDMERIGDQASDIAEICKFVSGNETAGGVHIEDMARATIKMVTDSINSFVDKDINIAKKVIDDDDIVDDLFNKVKEELISLIGNNPQNGETYIDMLMIAKYFERIGDHATNIAEWVEFAMTGYYKGELL